jgi:hypothetical protein
LSPAGMHATWTSPLIRRAASSWPPSSTR